MTGLVPGIYVFFIDRIKQAVDARDKPGYDD
jgi:hypothetical protein